MKTRRYFECRCGHKLRFGARYCGDCHDDTPSWNRRWFWRLLAATGFAMLATGAAVALV